MVVDRNYHCSVTKPDDFDDFWDGVMDDVNSIDLDPCMEIDPLRSNDEVDVYQVFYNSLDHVRISAWYSLPKGATAKLPTMIQLPGYQSDPPIAREWATKGYACISVNPTRKGPKQIAIRSRVSRPAHLWNRRSRFCQNSVPGQNSIVPHSLRRSCSWPVRIAYLHPYPRESTEPR
jgi:hypothetical protein